MSRLGLRFKFQDALILPGRFSARMGCMTAFLLMALIFLPISAQASLNLSIAINPDPAAAGDYLNVALTVSNTSAGDDLTDVVLTLTYPEHLNSMNTSYYLSDGGYAIGSDCDTGEIVTWEIGTLPAGTAKTVTLPPRIADDTLAGTEIEFAPQVSDSSGSEITASRSVIVVSDRVLELVTSADAEPVQPGEEFRYTLTYGHTATSTVIPDTILELPLPDGVSFVSATEGGMLADGTVQWDLGTMDPGQIGRVQVTVAVDESTAHGSLLQTQAVIRSTSQPDTLARADTVTRVEQAPPLLLAVEVLPEPAEAGDYLDVALTVSNAGSSDRSDIILKFRYPEHLDSMHVSHYLSDDGYAIGSYCDTGEIVTWEIGTLPAGTSKTVTLPPMITAGTPAGTLIEISPEVYDSTGKVSKVSRCIPVENDRVLELVAAADAEPVQPGDEFRYTLTYGHTATSAVIPDALLALPLPDGVSFISATEGGTLADHTVQWDLGTLDPGQIGRVQVTVAVDESTAHGSLLQTQAVIRSTSQTDTIARADTVTRVEEKFPLLLAVEVLPEPAEPGGYLDVALTVSNTSTFDRSNIVLKFRYPEHLDSMYDSYYLSDGGYSATGGYCEFGRFVYWEIETLPAGASKTVTLPPMVTAGTPAGTLIEISPEVYDSTGKVNRVSRCIPVENDRVLELVAAADAEPVQSGEEFRYTLTYGHTAISAVIPDALLTLPLPDGVNFVSATEGGTLADGTVQWDLGILNPGQIGRVQVTVTVDESTVHGSLLQTQAVIRSTSQTETIARADIVTQVEEAPALLVSVAVRSEPAEAGEYLDIALTVSNESLFDRSDVVLKLRYPEHLDSMYDSYYLSDGGYSATGGYCEFGRFVYWDIGTLPKGTSKTVTLPPMITAGTAAGEVIELNPLVSDSSEAWMTINRCIAVQNERNLELLLNTGLDSIQPDGLLIYTLSYGIRATSSSVSDTVLALSLPDNVSFVSATGGGALSGDTVQWVLGAMEGGQVGDKQVTVSVDSEPALGYLMEAQAVLKSAGQSDLIIRADATTKIVEETPLLLSIQAEPALAEPGEQLDTELTITNTSSFDRSDIVLQLRYPEHLDSMYASYYLSDDGYSATGGYCEFRRFLYWDIENLSAGASKTVTLPPTVSSTTIDGTLIDFDAVVYDATARSRAEHTVQIGQLASEIEAYMLTVGMTGNGSVNSNPAGIDCPGDCTENYSAGTQVTLTAVPDNGWTFKEWTGGCTGTQANCVVTLSGNSQVTATFIEQNSDPQYMVLTDDTPETLVAGSNTIVYGSHGSNVLFLENGSVATLKNFPGSNTITILSNSDQFTVSRSGATVTFTGSNGTTLVMPATSTVQSIIFTDKTLELKISSGAVMLGNQTILASSAAVE